MKSKHLCHYFEHNVLPVDEVQCCHPDVYEIAKMADGPWLASANRFTEFSETFLLDMLVNFPITCVEIRSKYHVIGGFRSWNVTMAYYKKHEQNICIPVQVIRRKMNARQRVDFAMSSVFFPLLSHSLGANGQEYIGHLWLTIERYSPELYKQLFRNGRPSKSRLPTALGKSLELAPENWTVL